MKVLITGVTGLVGERLVPRLVEAGLECRVLVRNGKQAPVGTMAVNGDLLDADSLEDAVTGVSAVIHLAAVFRTTDDDLIWRSNLQGTRNLIEAVGRCAPQARVVMASTSNIYDADAARPSRETDAADPKQAYPASKLAAERILGDSGLAWSVLRFAFVYGDGDGHIRSMPNLAKAHGIKFQPAARMSTVHHRDIAHAIRLALTGALDGRVVNLADDAPASMYEIFRLAGEPMEPSSAPLENPWHLVVDNTAARELGFWPEIRSVFHAAEEDAL